MGEMFYWILLILLAVIIGNQTRERQERETKGMSKKRKEKYFQDIKNKQWENTKKILFWFGIIILTIVVIILMFLGKI